MKFFPVALLSFVVALCPSLFAAEVIGDSSAAKADPAAASQYVQVVQWNKSDGRRFTLADSELTVELADPAAADGSDPFATGKKQHVKLSAEQAKETWEEIDTLQIPKWRGIYDATDSGQGEPGGIEWTVEFRRGTGKKFESRGANAFPALHPLGMVQLGNGGLSPDSASAFSELVATLQALAH